MGFTRHYIKNKNFVLTLVRDKVNNQLLEEHVLALTTETKDLHPLKELADVSELQDLSGLTEDGIVFSASLEFERNPHQKDKLAILVSTDKVYELAAMYTNISCYYRYDAKVFREYQLAIKWLGVVDLTSEINKLRQIKSNN